MTVLKKLLWVWLILAVLAGFTQAAEEKEEKKAVPVIHIEEPVYDFKQISQGEVVKHDFRVFNRGNSALEIKSVKPG